MKRRVPSQAVLDWRRPGLVAGVDEAGRGPLAGPVVAAAVILDPGRPIEGLADSKTLGERRREALAVEIRSSSIAWGLGSADPAEVDALNILQATFLAMRRALQALGAPPSHVVVDGNPLPGPRRPRLAVHRRGRGARRCDRAGDQRRLHPRQVRT